MSEKATILSNFNTSYKHNLQDLLIVYAEIPLSQNISDLKLKDITFDYLTLSFKHDDLEFEILKPIELLKAPNSNSNSKDDDDDDDHHPKNWDEVKRSLIYMCNEAASKRGLSPIKLEKVTYPCKPFDFFLLGCIGFNIYNLLWLKNFNYLHLIVLGIWLPIHLVEMYVCLIPRLRKFRIPQDAVLEWVVMTFLEGYPIVRLIDGLVKEEEASNDGVYFNLTTLQKRSEYF
ncbi:unnamed protein product [Ambrosiozyma monospora]|uniref:Unnamed protein product n=1 Tax=Ambrosiozyma monospora TaxID=43982 RepID=A0A9W6YTZ2_AMBMO|nr:unnamed protein product [Ambrosiozyma monospora]